MNTNPVITFSANVWYQLGYIYPRDKRHLVTLIPGAMVLSLQLSYLLFSKQSFENITMNSYFFVLHLNCLVGSIVSV